MAKKASKKHKGKVIFHGSIKPGERRNINNPNPRGVSPAKKVLHDYLDARLSNVGQKCSVVKGGVVPDVSRIEMAFLVLDKALARGSTGAAMYLIDQRFEKAGSRQAESINPVSDTDREKLMAAAEAVMEKLL